MPESRRLESETDAISRMDAKIAELESKLVARATRKPTGSMDQTLATVAPKHTLLLDGSTVSRTKYAALWKWVNDTNAAGFGDGDGSTTFTLPDMRDRVPVGAGNQYSVADTGGTDDQSFTLSSANMPEHSHTGSADTNGNHSHSMDSAGHHGGHVGSEVGRTNGSDRAAHPSTHSTGSHTHDINGNGSHSHNVTINSSGSSNPDPVPVDVRQPYIAVNYLIWT